MKGIAMKDATLAQGNQVLNLILQKKKESKELQDLLESGLLGDVLDVKNPKIIDRKVLRKILNLPNEYIPTNSQKRAQEIMGKNYIGVDMVMEKFNVTYTDEQLNHFNEIPFSENILEECKKTHILVAGYLMNILEIRKRTPEGIFYYNDDPERNEYFVNHQKVQFRWYLIRKEDVIHSRNKRMESQLKYLGKDEQVPTASEIIYTVVLYYLVTGEKLFPNYFVRSSTCASNGDSVYIGRFNSDGLVVGRYWLPGFDNKKDIGLASEKRFKE